MLAQTSHEIAEEKKYLRRIWKYFNMNENVYAKKTHLIRLYKSTIGPVKQKKISVKFLFFSYPSVKTCVFGA